MREILSLPLALIVLIILFQSTTVNAQQSGYLTEDGAWCWFSDPRAIMVNDTIITGWVKANGTIESGRLSVPTREMITSELYFMLESDDHDNPAFVHTADDKVLAMYTRHGKKDLFINEATSVSAAGFPFTVPEFIHSFSASQLAKFPRPTMTYANPFRLKEENNRIYCFGRWTGFKPNVVWSDDNGATWSKSKVVITNYPFDANNRPYVKYYSDGNSRIHLVFTDGHPRDEPTNSVYYAYYQDGAFYNVEGELITTMENIPFEPKDASVVYTSNPKEGRAWVADIGQNAQEEPVILYTRSPTVNNHEYWYGRYENGQWVNRKICDSGPWFPQTQEGAVEREPHYFGGMSIHPDKPGVVYLSRRVDGFFEIERWETKDAGISWTSKPITRNSTEDNVRPYVPRGLRSKSNEVVLWMENEKYIHYTDFKTSIRYYILTGK